MEEEITNGELMSFIKGQFEEAEQQRNDMRNDIIGINVRLDKMDDRMEKFDARLIGISNRVDQIAGQFTQDHFERFHKLEQQVAELMASR